MPGIVLTLVGRGNIGLALNAEGQINQNQATEFVQIAVHPFQALCMDDIAGTLAGRPRNESAIKQKDNKRYQYEK